MQGNKPQHSVPTPRFGQSTIDDHFRNTSNQSPRPHPLIAREMLTERQRVEQQSLRPPQGFHQLIPHQDEVGTAYQLMTPSKRALHGIINETNKKVKTDQKEAELNDRLKLCTYTGPVAKILKWHELLKSNRPFYEVIGPVVSWEEGRVPLQKIMLLRDTKGPVLQVIFYDNDYINIDIFVHKIIRCVGRMVGPNMLRAFKIREAKPPEISTLQRMYLMSDRAIMQSLSRI